MSLAILVVIILVLIFIIYMNSNDYFSRYSSQVTTYGSAKKLKDKQNYINISMPDGGKLHIITDSRTIKKYFPKPRHFKLYLFKDEKVKLIAFNVQGRVYKIPNPQPGSVVGPDEEYSVSSNQNKKDDKDSYINLTDKKFVGGSLKILGKNKKSRTLRITHQNIMRIPAELNAEAVIVTTRRDGKAKPYIVRGLQAGKTHTPVQ